jgi:hypothetical protein
MMSCDAVGASAPSAPPILYIRSPLRRFGISPQSPLATNLEFALGLLVVVSAAAGYLLGRVISPVVGRFMLALGIIALALGLGVLVLVAVGWGTVWTGGLITVPLVGLAAISLPFGLGALYGRR